MCQREIVVQKHPLARLIYHETPPTAAPVENYVVIQHWKEFELNPSLADLCQSFEPRCSIYLLEGEAL